ncbi:hypothetical protein [Dyadobacter sp. CY356]|uniref:type IV toxin-antitoxin system AbiEi family antitoxin domain-containing protein n=1 Tax=Dyadobacter sp. CY356 TaxID=2906442 RepID=UPI001F1960AC|nr:hypothetical protein [Dyadobacter sp. CY356]MCF0054844.1 hypothetical protein [Dyadobacter sp. CY356]
MNFFKDIQQYSGQPLSHQLLMSLLTEYKRPNDKINELIANGSLTSIKKGLYFSSLTKVPERFLVANHIVGPSYVSFESALSFYGFIPEQVYEVSSATIKSSRRFDTSLGRFTYQHLGLPYYSLGITNETLGEGQTVLMARPEKAVFDKIVTTSGVILRSVISAATYVIEDLRMDESLLKELDTDMMEHWLALSPKKDSLATMIKMIKEL